MAARTLDELLEVGGAEGGDGDGILRPERGLLVAVGIPLQIPQDRREHERRGHLAAGERRRAEEGRRGGVWFWVGERGNGRGRVASVSKSRAGGVKFREVVHCMTWRAHASRVKVAPVV